MNSCPSALIVATMDTKGEEAVFISDCKKKEGVSVRLMDAGIKGHCRAISIFWLPAFINIKDSSLQSSRNRHSVPHICF